MFYGLHSEGCDSVILIANSTSIQNPGIGNLIAADDNPMKLMSIAMKPLCEPPFPPERIKETTTLTGGDGSLRQHRAIASAVFGGAFVPILPFEKLEIHPVFLRFSYVVLCQKLSPNSIAELRGDALK